MDNLGLLNQVRQAFDADEVYLATRFEVWDRGELVIVTILDAGVGDESNRYTAQACSSDAEAAVPISTNPSADVSDVLRELVHKWRSRTQ